MFIGKQENETSLEGGERKPTQDTGISLAQRVEGKYKWDKKHCCKFCSKFVLKTSTHFQNVHSKEPEVAKILAMEKGSKICRRAWIALQDEGDYLHNVSVLEKRSGFVIPKYRTKTKRVEDLLACCHCKGLYRKNLLSVHTKRCHQKPSQSTLSQRGDAAKRGRLMLPFPFDVEASFYHKVLARQKDDDIGRLIKKDWLVLEFGKRLFDRRV